MTDGHVIGIGDELLRAGWILDLPADGPAGAEAPEPASLPTATEVVVEPGDNLWDISEDRLADDLDREPTDPETGIDAMAYRIDSVAPAVHVPTVGDCRVPPHRFR